MNHRWWWTTATCAAVIAATVTTFGQAPAATQKPRRADQIRAAMAAGENDRENPRARVEDIRQWQNARKTRAEKMPFDQPAEALVYFLAKRLPEGQLTLSPDSYLPALAQADSMPTYSTALQQFVPRGTSVGTLEGGGVATATSSGPGTWSALGPGNIGGRTRAILIHPTTPDTMWAAGVAGGIWKTTDGGANWSPKADLLVNIAVNSMILDPRDPNHLYAGTGEGFFNADGVRGAGILQSLDGGESWTRLASTATPDFYYVQKITMSKGSSQRIYAATRTGVWRTNDAGASWAKVLDGSAVNGCMDVTLQTDRSLAFVFASCGTFTQAAVYRALDTAGTQTWTKVLSPANMGRTSLAIAPSNQNVIYALAASNQSGNFLDGLLGVYRSSDSGKTWTLRASNTSAQPLNTVLLSNPVYAFLSACGFGTSQYLNQGWYDNVIAVDPKNPDVVWAGGIDLFRSDDGGLNFGQASHWWFADGIDREYNHADHHALVFHPNYDGVTNKVMFSGSDGGLHKTDDARAPVSYSPAPITASSPVCGNTAAGLLGWAALNNGYQTTQFYHGLAYPDGQTFFGGTQDNGTLRGTVSGGGDGWTTIKGGDGGYVALNPGNTNMLWAENTGRSLTRSTNGGVSYTAFTSGNNESSGNYLFIAPFTQDPANADNMWMAGAFPWRTTQATASPLPATIWTRAGAFFGVRVSAIAVDPTDSNRVYMGSGTGSASLNGTVFRTAAALTATSATVWATSKPRSDSNYVSWLAVDPISNATVYATVSTFNSATGVGHVFKSTDFGATWTSIDGSGVTAIPDVPVHCILVDPDNNQNLWVGTDIGVFVSTDGGANWARENTGFANVITESLDLKTDGGTKYIYAFTHGRSVFRVAK
jgi:photosystem II stability/assembly factor-like uncharacterized protein